MADDVYQELQDMFYEIRRTRAAEGNPAMTLFSTDEENMVPNMMALIADLANMCETMFMQLVLIHTALQKDDEEPNIGLKAFQSSSDKWKETKES